MIIELVTKFSYRFKCVCVCVCVLEGTNYDSWNLAEPIERTKLGSLKFITFMIWCKPTKLTTSIRKKVNTNYEHIMNQ